MQVSDTGHIHVKVDTRPGMPDTRYVPRRSVRDLCRVRKYTLAPVTKRRRPYKLTYTRIVKAYPVYGLPTLVPRVEMQRYVPTIFG